MKNVFVKGFIALSLVAFLTTSCKNNDKKITDVDSKADSIKAVNGMATSVDETKEVKPEGPLPVMQFETMDHDFGTIKEGDIVEYTYAFKNSGEAPLVIQDVKGSCGCTVPDWSKEPVAVGGTGFIKAKFDSHGKHDLQNKTVTVTANTFPKQTVLNFTAMVTAKPAEDKAAK